MENLKQWGSFVFFLCLAGISCWATEHSFHLLITFLPEIFIWGLTIAFFIVASIGTKWIVDGLNQDIYLENRRRTFWLGITFTLCFWLLMSMPTNTHTFFYNHNIGNTLQDDISTTSTYLDQIATKQNIDSTYYDVMDDINQYKNGLVAEFNGLGVTGKKGNGQYVQQYVTEINNIFANHNVTLVPLNTNFNTMDTRILNQYLAGIQRGEQELKACYQVSSTSARNAKQLIAQLDLLNDTVTELVQMKQIQHAEDIVNQAEGVLSTGYSCVKSNAAFVQFIDEEDEKFYTQANLETRTKRMLSVIDVWIDFVGGKYPLSFLFYVLVSILVDIAAFIFFDIAFCKRD